MYAHCFDTETVSLYVTCTYACRRNGRTDWTGLADLVIWFQAECVLGKKTCARSLIDLQVVWPVGRQQLHEMDEKVMKRRL